MKKYYPKIKFGLNKDFEKAIFLNFLSAGEILKPELKFLAKNKFKKYRKEIVSNYVDDFYSYMNQSLLEDTKEIEHEWEKVEKYYFKQVDKLFYNFPWPKGNYRGYISVWHRFPRFIKNKTFSFPHRSGHYNNMKLALRIVAHEMLHFITYDYLIKKFKLKPSECYHKDNKFWQFTENLNVLIENEKYWQIFSQGYKSQPYTPVIFYNQMKKIWDKNKDLDNLIEKIFKVKKHG